jgi:hypothetical protein
MIEDIDFGDLKPLEVKIKLFDKHYILREASLGAQCAYENERMRGMKYDEAGKAMTMLNLADAEPVLIANCLYEMKPEGERLVLLGIIRSWPYRVTVRLSEMIKEMSPQLREREKREILEKRLADTRKMLADIDAEENGHLSEKNLPNATTDTSV